MTFTAGQVLTAAEMNALSATYVKQTVTPPGAPFTTTSSTFAEVDASLRCTILVPDSGHVLVRQSMCIYLATMHVAEDAYLGVQVDGAGGYTITGSFSWTDPGVGEIGLYQLVTGETDLTGLSPGSHDFYMGWRNSGNVNQLASQADSRTGVVDGTWQSVLTLP